MADDYTPWISSLFASDQYTITRTGGTAAEYYTDASYGIDFVDSIVVDGETKELPLALLFCLYQIAFSDLAAAKAEDYLAKIEGNQELQSAANTAIALAESLQEDVYATTSAFISANSDWVTMDAWSATYPDNTNYDYAFGTLLPAFLEDAGYVAVSGDDFTSATATWTTNDNEDGSIKEAVWTLSGFSVMDEAGNVYEITVTYTVDRLSEKTTLENGNTVYYDIDKGTFTIASGDGVDDATTNVLTTTLDSVTDADIFKACVLAEIDEIAGNTIYTIDDDGVVTYTNNVTLTSAQLDTLLEELELAQENASSSTQTDMVYAEEYLGQYNSYLTGSSSTLDDFNTSIMSIAGRIG